MKLPSESTGQLDVPLSSEPPGRPALPLWAARFALAGVGLALAHTVVIHVLLTMLTPGAEPSLWGALTAPIVDWVGRVVPSVARVAAEVAQRSSPQRAQLVGTALAFDWLFIVTGFVPTIVFGAKIVVRREWLVSSRNGGDKMELWRICLCVLFTIGMFWYVIFLFPTSSRGRGPYNLLSGNGGLYVYIVVFLAAILMAVSTFIALVFPMLLKPGKQG